METISLTESMNTAFNVTRITIFARYYALCRADSTTYEQKDTRTFSGVFFSIPTN